MAVATRVAVWSGGRRNGEKPGRGEPSFVLAKKRCAAGENAMTGHPAATKPPISRLQSVEVATPSNEDRCC